MAKKPRIAPRDLIDKDFRDLDLRTNLATTWDLERALLEIVVTSHAHEGDGVFNGQRFVDTTEDHVARALNRNADAEKQLRQRWIQEIGDWVTSALDGKAPRRATRPDGMPLLGAGMLRWIELDPEDVLRGFVLGGMRDKPLWRCRAQEAYGIEIGYGQMHPIDLEKMAEAGLSGDALAHQPHESELESLKQRGIILPQDAKITESVQPMYVRYQAGPGASDDAAILCAGKLHGIGAAVGCFFADAIDTLEKYTEVFEDQDYQIAAMIRDRKPDLGVTDDEIVQLTYLASTPPYMLDTLPDSSLRDLLQLDRKVDLCPIESHLLWLLGLPWSEIPLGPHPHLTNKELYQYIDDRIQQCPKPR